MSIFALLFDRERMGRRGVVAAQFGQQFQRIDAGGAGAGGPVKMRAGDTAGRAHPADRLAHDRMIAAARAQTDSAVWRAAWEEGRQMRPSQAIVFVNSHSN